MRPRAAGAHGAEIREAEGGAIRRLAPDLPPAFVAEVGRLFDRDAGVLVAFKGAMLAVHYWQAAKLG